VIEKTPINQTKSNQPLFWENAVKRLMLQLYLQCWPQQHKCNGFNVVFTEERNLNVRDKA